MPIIKPTVGRAVWFYPWTNVADPEFARPFAGEPCAAIIAKVWNDSMVNLTVFDANGNPHSRTSIQLVQDGQPIPGLGGYCCWMPYQLGQAAKTEAAQLMLDSAQRPTVSSASPNFPQPPDEGSGD